MIEAAVILPVLFLIMWGIIELSVLYIARQDLSRATAETLRLVESEFGLPNVQLNQRAQFDVESFVASRVTPFFSERVPGVFGNRYALDTIEVCSPIRAGSPESRWEVRLTISGRARCLACQLFGESGGLSLDITRSGILERSAEELGVGAAHAKCN